MAVRVPKAYFDTSAASRTATANLAFGFEVQTPPCFTQKVQPHARAGISGGSPFHSSSKAMLPQWHLPVMSIWIPVQVGRLASSSAVCGALLAPHGRSKIVGVRKRLAFQPRTVCVG